MTENLGMKHLHNIAYCLPLKGSAMKKLPMVMQVLRYTNKKPAFDLNISRYLHHMR